MLVTTIIVVTWLGSVSCGVGRVLVPFTTRTTSADERLDRRLGELWFEVLDRSPERATRIGRGVGSDDLRWRAVDPAARREAAALVEASLDRLARDFDPDDLTPANAARLRRVIRALSRERDAWQTDEPPRPHPWAGVSTTAPSFLAHVQPAHDTADLGRWVERLRRLGAAVASEAAEVEAGRGAARLPRPLLEATQELLRPLAGGGASSPLLEPFESAAARFSPTRAEGLVVRAQQVVRDEVQPAYARLLAALEARLGSAGEFCGAWRDAALDEAWRAGLTDAQLPKAPDLALEPEELHELGRREVQRLLGELRALAPEGVELTAWLERLRAEPRAVPGHELGVRPAIELWTLVQPELGMLVDGAKAPLPSVSPAHAWDRPRGRWSPLVPASADGVRRARLLVLPSRSTLLPPWMREVSSLRHGLPGRALFDRLVIEAEVPRLLAHGESEPHAEGWSLWLTLDAVRELPGLERDGGFGRIASELTEAAALVADTGLHGRRWSRGQTEDFLLENTPLPRPFVEDLVLRIAAEPGRAAAPFLGLVAMRALERHAQLSLGSSFDAARFRRALTAEGVMSPAELEEVVDAWIVTERDASPVASTGTTTAHAVTKQ